MQALEWAVPYRRRRRRDHPDREHARAPAAGRRLERDRAQRHHRRSGLAGRPLLRHRPRADGGHGRRAHGRTHHVSVGAVARADKFGRRLQFADDIRYTLTEPEFEVESYLRHQADTLREALRRQHLSLHVAGAVLLRPRAAVRRRPARARGARRLGAHAAHRVQLRLAVSAVGLRGAGGRAPRRRQGRRAPRDRRAVRTRLFSAGGGAPDSYDSGVPRSVRFSGAGSRR